MICFEFFVQNFKKVKNFTSRNQFLWLRADGLASIVSWDLETKSWHQPLIKASPGELVFEENWDDFNLDIWEHEISMGGGGNWEFQTYYNNRQGLQVI